MTRIVTNTNIIVDDFDFGKSFPKRSFIYFLTHFHADHYEGISPLWDYGDIHCTHQTKKFLINKYPKLKNIYSYDYYQPYTLEIVPQKLKVTFYFFDAKHIPGSAMILFQGYMGSILYTGDFRYNYSMVVQNQILFPPQKRQNHDKQQIVQKMEGITLHVDQMVFDNTYCNQAFNFLTQDPIAKKMISIITKNSDKKLILIAMGALGKHRIILKIAEYFQTNIIVSDNQFQKIRVAGLRTDFLTTNPEEGYIKLISKKKRRQIIEETKYGPFGKSFICIDTDFLMLEHQSPDEINYIVPYSLHSNFQEMKTLIKLVKPCILRKLVIPFANFKQIKLRIKIDHRLKFAKYLDFIEQGLSKSKSGYASLVSKYTEIYNLSEEYLKWFNKKSQRNLMNLFGLGNGEQNHNLRKRKVTLDDQQNLTFKSNTQSRSLKNIAGELNAVNKNLTLQRCIQQAKNKKQNRIFEIKLKQFNCQCEGQQQEQKLQSEINTEAQSNTM